MSVAEVCSGYPHKFPRATMKFGRMSGTKIELGDDERNVGTQLYNTQNILMTDCLSRVVGVEGTGVNPWTMPLATADWMNEGDESQVPVVIPKNADGNASMKIEVKIFKAGGLHSGIACKSNQIL